MKNRIKIASLLEVVSIPLYFILYYFYQNGEMSWFVFVGIIPLLFSINNKKILFKSSIVFLSGFIFYYLNYQWLTSFNKYSIFLVSFFCSLFRLALPYFGVSKFYKRGSLFFGLFLTSIFTITEYITKLIPAPFPYGSMSLGLFSNNTLLQILDVIGQFGLTFLIYFINYVLFLTLKKIFNKEFYMAMRNLFIYLAIASLWIGYGYLSRDFFVFGDILNIDLAQSKISSIDKVSLTKDDYLTYIDLFFKRRSDESEIIIFPETFFYSSIEKSNNQIGNYLLELSKRHKIAAAGGFIEDSLDNPKIKYNSFITISDEEPFSVSRKSILAPFGEYYPLGKLFPKFKSFLRNRQGAFFFYRGVGLTKHNFTDKNGEVVEFVPLICFEAAFSSLLRTVNLEDTDFLVNVSSDLWTNSLKGMIHNSMFSKFRAIEYRKPLVRVSNGGLTGYISASGKTWLPIPAFSEGNAHIKLARVEHQIYKNGTPYSNLGDIIIPISFIIVILFIFLSNKVKQKSS